MQKIVGALLIGLVRIYQLLVSPVFVALGVRCRFYPSCSAYAAESVQHFGPVRGSLKALGRLCRCHPLHPGGYDPVLPPSPPAGDR